MGRDQHLLADTRTFSARFCALQPFLGGQAGVKVLLDLGPVLRLRVAVGPMQVMLYFIKTVAAGVQQSLYTIKRRV